MRLISQKGLNYTDVEYENVAIGMGYGSHNERKRAAIYCVLYSRPNDTLAMAEYDSKEKAEKVLEQMAGEYGTYIRCDGGAGIAIGSGYQQAFCYTPPKVFRFPANEEVEA